MPKWESVLVTGFGHPENNSMLSVSSWSSKLPSDSFSPWNLLLRVCACVCVCEWVVRRYLHAHVCMLSHFNCVQLCNPMDCSLPGFSVHWIVQARLLEWAAMPSSRGSSQPRDWTHVFYVSCFCRWVLYHKCQSQTWFFWLNISQCKASGYRDDWVLCCESYWSHKAPSLYSCLSILWVSPLSCQLYIASAHLHDDSQLT